MYLVILSPLYTLENHCTRTVQSSRDGCSRRVHTIVYLHFVAVNKGNILVNFLFLKYSSRNISTYKYSCVSS